MSVEILQERSSYSRRYVAAVRGIFADIQEITGERPHSISQRGDSIEVTWPDGVSQRVRLAPLFAAATEIRSGRRARHRARRREREEFRAYMQKATKEAARQARLRMGG